MSGVTVEIDPVELFDSDGARGTDRATTINGSRCTSVSKKKVTKTIIAMKKAWGLINLGTCAKSRDG